MREGSVLARSGSFGLVLRGLANKVRRIVALIARVLRTGSEVQQHEDELSWLEAYKAALLEFNERRASLAINEAMKAIERRKQVLQFVAKNAHELDLLKQATSTLLTIRKHREQPTCPSNEISEDLHDVRRLREQIVKDDEKLKSCGTPHIHP